MAAAAAWQMHDIALGNEIKTEEKGGGGGSKHRHQAAGEIAEAAAKNISKRVAAS